jgi:hypothetical protein
MKAIRDYYYSGENKVEMKQFRDEWVALTVEDRQELAEGIVAITGDTLIMTNS